MAVERIVVEADLVLVTAAHLGSGVAGEATDAALLRDERDPRLALLTGESLGGAMRAYLNQREYGWFAPERQGSRAERLFGGLPGDPKGRESLLVVANALSNPPCLATAVRTGVAINPETRTALDGALFDAEVLEPGTTFTLRWELRVPDVKDGEELRCSLATALYGLTDPVAPVRLGARTNRGWGRTRIGGWRVRRFDMRDTDDLFAFLRRDAIDARQEDRPSSTTDIASALEASLLPDKRCHAYATGLFHLESSLLVRATPEPDETGYAPDTRHLRSGGESIVPGTSLAGVMRSRARMICNTLAPRSALISIIFGTAEQAGCLRTEETTVEKGREDLVQFGITIDAFTGGVVTGALFAAQPVFGRRDNEREMETVIPIRILLKNPTRKSGGLLLHVLRDLWMTDLPIGGERSVGRGRLHGKSLTIRMQSWYGNKQHQNEWIIESCGGDGQIKITGDNISLLEKAGNMFYQYLCRSKGS